MLSIDREGGDIKADLSMADERMRAVDEILLRCPDGIDGLACIAGISNPNGRNSSVVAVNYYGSIRLAEMLLPSLKRRHGACVMTTSASIAWSDEKDIPDFSNILLQCDDEERVLEMVDSIDLSAGFNLYYSSKIAVARWARRHSIEWGLHGVRLALIAPGCVATRLSQKTAKPDSRVNESFHMTLPMHYKSQQVEEDLMSPNEVAEAFAFLLSNEAKGCSGSIYYIDAGQETYYAPDKLYY